MGLTAVVAVVLIGVYITLGNTMIIVGAAIASVLLAAQWFYFNRNEDELETE